MRKAILIEAPHTITMLILLLVSSLFIPSCGGNRIMVSGNTHLEDSSINSFTLREVLFPSSTDTLPNTIDDSHIGEFIGFSNASCSEFLLLVHENGGKIYQFNYFYLTDSIPSKYAQKMTVLQDTTVITTFGAHIGISERDFCDKYKEFEFTISKEANNKTYEFIDSINHYRSIYTFNNGYLHHLEFGYVW